MSNYPMGVSDSHPYFNPQEGSVHVTCNNDEAKVVPSHAVHEMLTRIEEVAATGNKLGTERLIADLKMLVTNVERDSDYECPFSGVMDVAISEEAEWTCPVCGGTRTSDTTPDERDPDEEWERRNER